MNDPADHGGATNFGITAADLGRWRSLGRVASVDEVRSMQVSEARDIYEKWYINDAGFGPIADQFLKWVAVDTGVLHGTKTSAKMLQQALGVTVDGVIGGQTMTALGGADTGHVSRAMLSIRIRRYGAIVAKDKTQIRFLEGWINRATSLLQAQ